MLSTYIVEVKILETGNICWVIASCFFCHGKWLLMVHLPVMTALEQGLLPRVHCGTNNWRVLRLSDKVPWAMFIRSEGLFWACHCFTFKLLRKNGSCTHVFLRRLFGIFFGMSDTNNVLLEAILLIQIYNSAPWSRSINNVCYILELWSIKALFVWNNASISLYFLLKYLRCCVRVLCIGCSALECDQAIHTMSYLQSYYWWIKGAPYAGFGVELWKIHSGN